MGVQVQYTFAQDVFAHTSSSQDTVGWYLSSRVLALNPSGERSGLLQVVSRRLGYT
jgi:hypothetical protein